MLLLARDTHIFSFSKHHTPVLNVISGSTVKFQTMDCFSNTIHSPDQSVEAIDYSRINPATGPVYIEGAEPGDVIKAEILEIRVAGQGVLASIPGIGTLTHTAESAIKILPIASGQTATFSEHIELDVRPMVGVIGVAPAGADIPCGHPGNHGGNMDATCITSGSSVYLPVNVSGALFALGDLHAAMGDGEICGVGIEVAGEVDVRLSVIKGAELDWPLVHRGNDWYTIASDHDLLTAIRLASESMQRLLVKEWELSNTEAYMLMGAAGDVQVNQACKPCSVESVVRFRMPQMKSLKPLIQE
ncbi:acetamidase/formamidase family protein [Paenibacillus beijingensis]|uniref:Acetamidase n=1 Tax=Paenibacillus beijingensis TaxID=1126833 RepID=A0A0D5NJE4_9BACL|nr:acetamidase/formamidase family protein [Paenibacillus beijingensis]AJY75386.1 hypothetical protein VN24_13420 [Paenibacillus beijingensis]